MTREFYEANDGCDERWVMRVPAYSEVLVREENLSNGDIAGGRVDLD